MDSSKIYKEITGCRACGFQNLTDVLSLGSLAVSDFVDNPATEAGIKAPLELVLCDTTQGGCGLLQLRHTVSSEAMYRNYWYRSGINQTMTEELADIAGNAARAAGLQAGDFAIDIGANDGTLLRGYGVQGLKTIGFEPARNLYEYGEKGTTKIIVDFFNHAAWSTAFGDAKAKAITAIGMFYDLDDPNSFLVDICKCLDDRGVFIIQMMYMPFAVERNAFDGICHEHLEYYTMLSLENLLARNGLEIFDVQMREEINEGSVRFFIRKKNPLLAGAYDEAGKGRVEALRNAEKTLGMEKLGVYEALAKRIQAARQTTLDFLKQEKAKGKKYTATRPRPKATRPCSTTASRPTWWMPSQTATRQNGGNSPLPAGSRSFQKKSPASRSRTTTSSWPGIFWVSLSAGSTNSWSTAASLSCPCPSSK